MLHTLQSTMLRYLIWVGFFLVLPTSILAQTFSSDFKPSIDGFFSPRTMSVQNDGKLIIGATDLKSADGNIIDGIVRINTDGSLDESFVIGTPINDSGFIHDILVQSDGKILIGGVSVFRDFKDVAVMRFNPNGSIDENFQLQPDIISLNHMAIQENGQILLAAGQVSPSRLLRLNEDGSLDESFALADPNGIGFNEFEILPLSSGKTIIVGSFDQFNQESRPGIVRLNSDGSVDETFDVGNGPSFSSGSYAYLLGAQLQSDGKILVHGYFDSFSGITTKNLFRLNADGSPDESFLSPDINDDLFDNLAALHVLSNDKVLVSSFSDVFMLNADGGVDNNYSKGDLTQYVGSDGSSIHPYIASSSDKLFISGRFVQYGGESRIGLASTDLQGNLLDYDPKLRGIPTIRVVKMQQDGKILIGGEFLGVAGSSSPNLARLNSDGSLDTNFTQNLGGAPDRTVTSLEILENGEIFVGGYFQSALGQEKPGLFKLKPDGTPDDEFDLTLRLHIVGRGIEDLTQDDDHLIVAGSFIDNVNNRTRSNLLRVNKLSGSIDEAFNVANQFTGSTTVVRTIKKQSDGKVLIGGEWGFGGAILKRLNQDGSADESFQPPFFSNLDINAIELLDNGEMLVGGYFSRTIPQNTPTAIIHLDQSGIVIEDQTLNQFGGPLLGITPFINGLYFFHGRFEQFNSVDRNNLALADINGQVDDFNLELGFKNRINGVQIIDDSFIMIFGEFTSVGEDNNFCSIALIKYRNKVPEITSTTLTSSPEDEKLTLSLSDFVVSDSDNNYPDDFTLDIGPGDNYTVDESIITPELDFYGELSIPITISDGIDNSQPFDLKLSVTPVNDAPVLTGTNEAITIEKGGSYELGFNNLIISDPDNTVPDDFSIVITEGSDYSFLGTTVTPDDSFVGQIQVNVKVSDGDLESNEVKIDISVSPVASLEFNQIAQKIHIYPNPAQTEVKLALSTSVHGEVSAKLFSGEASLVKEIDFKKGVDSYYATVNLAQLSNGLYYVHFFIDDKLVGKSKLAIAR